MLISRTKNGGKPSVSAGWKKVSSQEVSPTTLTAVASPGLTFDVNLLDNFNFFVGAQTSAGTDRIAIPASFPVGGEIKIQCNSALTIASVAGSGVLINGGADTLGVAIAANSTAVIYKVSSTRLIVHQIATSGAITAPAAA